MQLLKYRFKKFSFLSGRMFMNRMSKYIYIYLYIYIFIYISLKEIGFERKNKANFLKAF